MRENWPTVLIFSTIIVVISFVVADCSMGNAVVIECAVTGKYYVPPETQVSSDADGNVRVSTDSEEFHVTVSALEGGSGYDLNAGRHSFATLTNGQIVNVLGRRGKWTKALHIGRIEP